MNERIRELAEQACAFADIQYNKQTRATFYTNKSVEEFFREKFAELIVKECRTVIVELYRKTSLELCGPLLTADEEIVKHFFGVEE